MATLELQPTTRRLAGATKRQAATAARAALEFIGLAGVLAVLAVGFLIVL